MVWVQSNTGAASTGLRRVLGQYQQGGVEFILRERLRYTLYNPGGQLAGNLRAPGLPQVSGFVVAFLQQLVEAGTPIRMQGRGRRVDRSAKG